MHGIGNFSASENEPVLHLLGGTEENTNPIFTVSNLQLQWAFTNINYKNIILLKRVAVAV
jgi:hypothetical protein